jgi:murein DD-endopeptidase MepM/ murein hydrolase activator NlpD
MAAALAVLSVVAGPLAGAGAQLPPGVTFPPTSSAPTTTAPPAPTTTAPAPTTTAPETKLIPVPPAGAPGAPGASPNSPNSPTTTAPAQAQPQGPATAPSTTRLPPASLSAGLVDFLRRPLAGSGASSTATLVEALKPLTNLGMTPVEALSLGMGQFPLLGLANWTDDWLDYRAGPPEHQHQGTDIFSAFDTPVRAPVDGIVRFEDAGLGGKGAFVTAPDGTYYYMAHLKSFHPDLASGAAVKQGQVVGYNGDSGNAKGGAPHVHFEVHPRGGAAVNPKPILDGWLQAAMAQVPALLASFQPKSANGAADNATDGVPQILVSTGLTRRFSAPTLAIPNRARPAEDFKRAVLGPLTPAALAPLLDD